MRLIVDTTCLNQGFADRILKEREQADLEAEARSLKEGRRAARQAERDRRRAVRQVGNEHSYLIQ